MVRFQAFVLSALVLSQPLLAFHTVGDVSENEKQTGATSAKTAATPGSPSRGTKRLALAMKEPASNAPPSIVYITRGGELHTLFGGGPGILRRAKIRRGDPLGIFDPMKARSPRLRSAERPGVMKKGETYFTPGASKLSMSRKTLPEEEEAPSRRLFVPDRVAMSHATLAYQDGDVTYFLNNSTQTPGLQCTVQTGGVLTGRLMAVAEFRDVMWRMTQGSRFSYPTRPMYQKYEIMASHLLKQVGAERASNENTADTMERYIPFIASWLKLRGELI